MSLCEILHLFSQVLIRNFLWCYYWWLITFIALEKCEKNVILFKLFWYNVFFHWKLRLLNFVMDSVLCVMLYFSVNAFRWRIHSDHVIVTRFIGAVVLARFASLLRSYARVRMCSRLFRYHICACYSLIRWRFVHHPCYRPHTPPDGLPCERSENARRLAKGCKFQILVSLRVFWAKPHYNKP